MTGIRIFIDIRTLSRPLIVKVSLRPSSALSATTMVFNTNPAMSPSSVVHGSRDDTVHLGQLGMHRERHQVTNEFWIGSVNEVVCFSRSVSILQHEVTQYRRTACTWTDMSSAVRQQAQLCVPRTCSWW